MSNKNDEKDKLLDHEYDGIRELDNHMPRWWVLGFYFTIAFGLVYMVYYHMAGGPSSDKEYQMEMAAAGGKQVVAVETSLKPVTDAASLAAGEKLYTAQTCAACHSPNLGGLVGPNLTDDFWIHGCDFSAVMGNIKKGFQQKGMMPYGNGKPLSDSELQQLVSYIFSKRGSNPPGAKAIDPEREKKCAAK
ncbi:MAG: c-type cytochrome [Leptospiraceae bacterium]|nr:c-type cytochrome [Leptospiraceae bacterium]